MAKHKKVARLAAERAARGAKEARRPEALRRLAEFLNAGARQLDAFPQNYWGEPRDTICRELDALDDEYRGVSAAVGNWTADARATLRFERRTNRWVAAEWRDLARTVQAWTPAVETAALSRGRAWVGTHPFHFDPDDEF